MGVHLAMVDSEKAASRLFGPEWFNSLKRSDLRQEVQVKLQKIEESGMNMCAKCRYKSGCKDFLSWGKKVEESMHYG